MARLDVIPEWVAALCAGDGHRAGAMLSGRFVLHEGMTADAYLAHELAEFGARRDGFGLAGRPDVLVDERTDGSCLIWVLSPDLRLAYEDTLVLDDEGRIMGNGRPLETVTKLSFQAGLPPRRAMAVRSHGNELRAVAPLFPVDDFSFRRAPTFGTDRFSLVEFDDGTDPIGTTRRFRAMLGATGVGFDAFMRGIDHPYFVPDRHPELDGNLVRLDLSSGPVWSLTAILEDSSVRVVDCPRDERIEFPCVVIGATMTDAIDNDWTIGVGRER